MNLIIYQAVEEDQIDYEVEDFNTFHWFPNFLPKIGELASLGGDRRWLIAEVEAYRPNQPTSQLDGVYLARVARADLPREINNEWVIKRSYPSTSMNIELPQEGKECLGYNFNMRGNVPQIGTRLLKPQVVEGTTKVQSSIRPWMIQEVTVCLPEKIDSCYSAIHLSWCAYLPGLASA